MRIFIIVRDKTIEHKWYHEAWPVHQTDYATGLERISVKDT